MKEIYKRIRAYGKVAEVGRYLLVQQESISGKRYDICVHNKETGEYLDKVTQELDQDVFFQNNINHDIGIVVASITSDSVGSKNRKVEVWDGIIGTGQKSFIRTLGALNDMEEEICMVLPCEEGKNQLCYSLISHKGMRIDAVKKEITRGKVEIIWKQSWHTQGTSSMAFIVDGNGVYIVSRAYMSDTRWAFVIAKKNGEKWIATEMLEVIQDKQRTDEIYSEGGLHSRDWYTKVEFE
jgi:hypothetical protein